MRVTLQPSGAVIQTAPNGRILDAARRLGYECPQSCRNGNCHVCAALLVEGRVRQNGAELSQGELFTCLAEPLEDCVLHWDGVSWSPLPGVQECEHYSVWGTSPSNLFVANICGIDHWDGSTWAYMDPGGFATELWGTGPVRVLANSDGYIYRGTR